MQDDVIYADRLTRITISSAIRRTLLSGLSASIHSTQKQIAEDLGRAALAELGSQASILFSFVTHDGLDDVAGDSTDTSRFRLKAIRTGKTIHIDFDVRSVPVTPPIKKRMLARATKCLPRSDPHQTIDQGFFRKRINQTYARFN